MNIIPKQPNSSGAYPPVQSWSESTPPDTHYEITADTTEFYNGFIIPTIENGVVTSFVCNAKAWEAWKASLPAPTPPPPTLEETVTALEAENKLKDAQIKALSDRNDFMDDCIAEMAAEVYK